MRERVLYIVLKVISGIYDGKEFVGVLRWIVNVGVIYNIIKGFIVNVDGYY